MTTLRPDAFSPAARYGLQHASTTRSAWPRRLALLTLALVATWALSSCGSPQPTDGNLLAIYLMAALTLAVIVGAIRYTIKADAAWWAAWKEREEDWSVARKRQRIRHRRDFSEDRTAPHDLPTFTEAPGAGIPAADLKRIMQAMEFETLTAADLVQHAQDNEACTAPREPLAAARRCLHMVIACQRGLIQHLAAERSAA